MKAPIALLIIGIFIGSNALAARNMPRAEETNPNNLDNLTNLVNGALRAGDSRTLSIFVNVNKLPKKQPLFNKAKSIPGCTKLRKLGSGTKSNLCVLAGALGNIKGTNLLVSKDGIRIKGALSGGSRTIDANTVSFYWNGALKNVQTAASNVIVNLGIQQLSTRFTSGKMNNIKQYIKKNKGDIDVVFDGRNVNFTA